MTSKERRELTWDNQEVRKQQIRESTRLRVQRWRKANPDKNKAQRQKEWSVRREYINSKKASPCKDCGGIFHPVAMDFDHRPGEKKLLNLSEMLNKRYPLEIIQEEIDKCDLVCACCHRLRTQKRLTPGL